MIIDVNYHIYHVYAYTRSYLVKYHAWLTTPSSHFPWLLVKEQRKFDRFKENNKGNASLIIYLTKYAKEIKEVGDTVPVQSCQWVSCTNLHFKSCETCRMQYPGCRVNSIDYWERTISHLHLNLAVSCGGSTCLAAVWGCETFISAILSEERRRKHVFFLTSLLNIIGIGPTDITDGH